MSAARRKRQKALAAHVAAGTFVPKGRKSHFLTVDIRDAVQADITAQRQVIAALRRPNMDPSWHYDEALRTRKARPDAV